TLPTYIPADRPVGAVDVSDIADVAAELLTGESLDGQLVVPTGPAAITTRQAADAVGAALGTEMTVDYIEPDRAWQELREAGWADWWIADLLTICHQASPEANADVATITGRPARTIVE